MTQNNNQSVRSEAEAALNTNRIPTFEEVYAMPYVQESIQAILEQNIRQYPLLATYQDDLRQEMLISLNDALSKYDGRSGIETFCRTCLDNAMKMARRQYFQKRNLYLSYAKSVNDFENLDDDKNEENIGDIRAYASLCRNSVEDEIREQDFMAIINALPPQLKSIALRLLNGDSIRHIEREMGVPHTTFRRKYLLPIRIQLKGKDF